LKHLPIPTSWENVTPEWMTAALTQSHPDVEVDTVELMLVDDGTNRRARFGLTYAAGSGPETLFLKAADPDHAALNAATGGLFNEARLFGTDLSLPIEHPVVYLALFDEPGLNFLLVMEDVTNRGGDPRDSTRPLTVEQATDGVRGLARLHSRFWGDRLTTNDELSWLEPLVAWQGMHRGITIGLQRCADGVPDQVSALTGREIEAVWTRYIATMTHETHTLLHGDPHVGNTYVLADNRVGFLDWQVAHRGHHAVDLGYFLQGAVTIEDRRACESDLVDEYLRALDIPDDDRPDRDETWLHYRASAAHGLALWMATAASDTWQKPEISMALAQRYAAAYAELDTAAAVDEISL
jgi:hypothetical protein